MPSFVNPDDVRGYLQATGTTGQWSDGLIGSNIRAASGNLQRWTNRQFGAQPATTKKFTSLGRSFLVIPDLRTATTVTLNGSPLIEDETFFLQDDRHQTGVHVGIEFPNRFDFLRTKDWFDRGYDSPLFRSRLRTGLPNDLVMLGDWGHDPLPAEVLHASAVLAAFYTIRPDALLSGARQTPEGNVFDLSRLPLEISGFVSDWKLDAPLVSF